MTKMYVEQTTRSISFESQLQPFRNSFASSHLTKTLASG